MSLAVAVTAAWPDCIVAVAAEIVAKALRPRRRPEAYDTTVDRLDRIVGRHRHRQRFGERRPDGGGLRGAAGDGGQFEPLALEGADVDVTGAGLSALIRSGCAAVVPPPMAGLPGSRAMVKVGPP